MLDKYNRSITYLRVSVTNNCNLSCSYCMPDGFSNQKIEKNLLSFTNIVKIVEAGTEIGIKKIRLTGGEPLLRKNIINLIREIKNISGIEELTLTTNGILLKNMAKPLKDAGLDRINISIDTLDPIKYKKITRVGSIENVLAGIEAVNEAGFKNTKINTVVMPNFNANEIELIKKFCDNKGLELQRCIKF